MIGYSETSSKANLTVQLSSVVIGLVGAVLLFTGFSMLYSAFIAHMRTFGLELSPVLILVGGYFAWIPYTIIRRYSRRAVRHFWIATAIIGIGLAFILKAVISILFAVLVTR